MNIFAKLKDISPEFIKSAITPYLEYEKAAKQPVAKAAELLGFDKEFLGKYTVSDSFAEYFKHFSTLHLFGGLESKSHSIGAQLALTNMYTQHGGQSANQCAVINHLTDTVDQVNKWATTYRLQVTAERELTTNQMYFLNRIADWVERDTLLYNDPSFSPGAGKCNAALYQTIENKLQVELIVRYLELMAIPGFDPDLYNSFSELAQYHTRHNKPEAETAFAAHKEACYQLANELTYDLQAQANATSCVYHAAPVCVSDLI